MLSLLPSTTSELAQRLGDDAPGCIAAAIAKLEHDLRPVPDPGDQRAEWATALDERLRRLAVKVLPTARAADTQEWRAAMVDALSDLPAMVSLTAAKRAIHRPYRFIGEIEAAVREIAGEVAGWREAQLTALRRHRAEIEGALKQQAALAAREPMIWTSVDVDQANASFRRLGLRTRYRLRADGDVDAVDQDELESEAA